MVGDISNLLCDLSSCSPPALLAEAELALAPTGSAVGSCTAGLCIGPAVEACTTGPDVPAVGKLGADSPVAEYHSSVTMSVSSINGALMTQISLPSCGILPQGNQRQVCQLLDLM